MEESRVAIISIIVEEKVKIFPQNGCGVSNHALHPCNAQSDLQQAEEKAKHKAQCLRGFSAQVYPCGKRQCYN